MSGDKLTKIDPYFWKTIAKDLENIEQVIIEKPAHGVLTLCQALAHKRHGHKYTKHQAAKWAKANLPEEFHILIDNALIELAGTYEKIMWNGRELITFADYGLSELGDIGEF